MKHILITGTNSYIGNAIERYLMEYNGAQGRELYRVDKISLREDSWMQASFDRYDAILHVAGIAHADIGKVSEEEKKRYYQVNRDLTAAVAAKAAAEGVSQFIFLSSVIVYGDSARVGEQKHITAHTKPQPANFYGDSKWQAEQKLCAQIEQTSGKQITESGKLSAKQQTAGKMQLAIVRPPMIYGKGSKGNFPLLIKMAKVTPVFPNIENHRSMLYIENLGEFLRLLIESGEGGTFFPQNAEYVTTAQMVQAIGEAMGKKIFLLGMLNPFVKLASKIPGRIGNMTNKAFGSLTIEQGLSTKQIDGYQIFSLEESIKRSL